LIEAFGHQDAAGGAARPAATQGGMGNAVIPQRFRGPKRRP
jgi:hypothetical protein